MKLVLHETRILEDEEFDTFMRESNNRLNIAEVELKEIKNEHFFEDLNPDAEDE